MLVQPHKENVMKTITQDQAYEMFLTGNQINVVKNKQVLVKQVQSEMQYTTVVAKEDGSLIVENAGTVSEGYLIRQIIYYNDVFTPCVESLGVQPEVKSADAESVMVGLFWLKE